MDLWLSFTVTDDYSDSESEAEDRFKGTNVTFVVFFVYFTRLFYVTFLLSPGSPFFTASAEQVKGQLHLLQNQKLTCEKGSPPARAFWVFPGRVAADVEGRRPVSAEGHAAVSS